MATCFGHCGQQICSALAEEAGVSEEQAVGMSFALGCGMGNGDACGCYTAALVLLGLRYGCCRLDDIKTKHDLMVEKVNEFEKRWAAMQSKLLCREILGIDVTKGDGMQRAMADGRIGRICMPLIDGTLKALSEMFAEDKARS